VRCFESVLGASGRGGDVEKRREEELMGCGGCGWDGVLWNTMGPSGCSMLVVVVVVVVESRDSLTRLTSVRKCDNSF
jgi:hypothetical protein